MIAPLLTRHPLYPDTGEAYERSAFSNHALA